MSQAGRYTPSVVPGTYVETLTGNTGGPVSPSIGGNIFVVGDGTLITVTGDAADNTLTISLGGSVADSYVTDSGTAVPALGVLNVTGGFTGLLFEGSGNTVTLTGGTLGVPYGGTDAATITGLVLGHGTSAMTGVTPGDYGVLISSSSGVPSWLANGTTGEILTATTSGTPSWASPAASSISITGDTGGALTGAAFTFHGGTTGLSFGGSGTTETLTFAGITANGGTVSLATDATTSTINIGTGAGAKTSTFGSLSSTSATSIQSGSGELLLESESGNIALSVNTSNTGNIYIGADANNYDVYVGSAGSKICYFGSGSAGSTTTILGGVDGTLFDTTGLYLGVHSGNTITVGNNVLSASPCSVVLGSPNTTSTTTIESGSGGLNIPAFTQGALVTSTAGLVTAVTGTAGYVLTANTGAAPSFQAAPASGIVTIDGDSGSVTGSTVTIQGTTSGAVFTGSGTTLTHTFNYVALPTTTSTNGQVTINGNSFLHAYGDSNVYNTFVGKHAGNFTLTGGSAILNTGVGFGALQSLTTGSYNCCLGYAAGNLLSSGSRNTLFGNGSGAITTGSYNIILGFQGGDNYTGAESSNIILNALGTASESNVTRIGAGTGTGNYQQNKCYISGIAGANVGSVATVVTESGDQLGTATITAGSGISVTAGANTITIAASGGSGITTIDGDSGSATGSTVTFNANSNSGSSVKFVASSATVNLNVTDSDHNTIIGNASGNSSISGSYNTGLGWEALVALTSGVENTAIGVQSINLLQGGSNNTGVGCNSLQQLVSGSDNTAIGQTSGYVYTGSESSNICIGYATGTVGESNTLHIGNATGTSAGNLKAAYICGIAGVNVGSVATVVTEASNQLGTAVLTAGTGISVTAGANTITIAASGGSGITTLDADSGSATGSTVTISGGTTGLTTTGSSATIDLTGTLAIANGGTNATSYTQSNGIVTYNGTRLVNYAGPQINSSGYMKNSSQPCFFLYLETPLSNVTGNGTNYSIVFDGTRFDQTSSTSGGVFTAPVAGIYFFTGSVFFTGLGIAHTTSYILIVRNAYAEYTTNPYFNPYVTSAAAPSGDCGVNGTVLFTLAQGDTVTLQANVTGGTQTVGLSGNSGSIGNGYPTFFSGYLIC